MRCTSHSTLLTIDWITENSKSEPLGPKRGRPREALPAHLRRELSNLVPVRWSLGRRTRHATDGSETRPESGKLLKFDRANAAKGVWE